jgi:DNA-binding LacI/PurR family transcriptional regulator
MRTFARTFAFNETGIGMMAKQRVTLKEVAVAAGVSYQTVSKVINKQVQVTPETTERIEQAVRALGYRPNYTARSLRSQHSLTIAYSWAPIAPGEVNSILDQFLQSVLVAAQKEGYYLLSFPYQADLHNQLAMYSELIDTGRVDGFVLSSIEYDDPRVQLLQQKDIPFVAFGRSNSELDFPWIDVDGGRGIELATTHLLELGHRRIAALAWPEHSRVGDNRMEGYYRALQSAGIEPHPDWIRRGEGRFAFSYRATLELLDLPAALRPTALVALNDSMAIGAMTAAKERGLQVGRDFAITGFDDAPLSQYLDPPLTTVHQPIWDVGQQIVPLLIETIRNGQVARPYERLITPSLVVRKSTTG